MTTQSCWISLGAALLFGAIHLHIPAHAQSQDNGVEATNADQDEPATIDRGKMRLNLLMKLVNNEFEEAKLLQSQLAAEAAGLDQEKRSLLEGPKTGSKAEERRLELVDDRLERIDLELSDVVIRLEEIENERTELQARLDEANGVVRQAEAEPTARDVPEDEATRWLDNKRRVQEALVYLGGYNALIDGDFGPRTREAIKIYQRSKSVDDTGLLTGDQEASLLDEADVIRVRYGVKTIEDLEQGYRITYPSGLLTEFDEASPDSRRYATADGEAELIITRIDEDSGSTSPADSFESTYEELLSRYEVQYRRKRDDWFVVAGVAEDSRIIYDTARLENGALIRARLTYPTDWRSLWSPFAVIMFNSFVAASPGES
jgi:hypothetical protein